MLDYEAGLVGQAALWDSSRDYARYQQVGSGGGQNIELDQGTIDFWYRPNYDESLNEERRIFGVGAESFGDPGFRLRHSSGGTSRELEFFMTDGNLAFQFSRIDSSAYDFVPGEWIHMRVTWDTQVAAGVPVMRMFLGTKQLTEVVYEARATGPINLGAEDAGMGIYIGAWDDGNQGDNADGAIDEFRIYDQVLIP